MIKPQTLVKNKKNGKLGVVVTDPYGVCTVPEEVPVVYEGTTYYSGTPAEDLEIIGPENAVADLEKCGAGRRETCCIFLTLGSDFKCARFDESLRWPIIAREDSMNAKRHPTEMYPKCQLKNK